MDQIGNEQRTTNNEQESRIQNPEATDQYQLYKEVGEVMEYRRSTSYEQRGDSESRSQNLEPTTNNEQRSTGDRRRILNPES